MVGVYVRVSTKSQEDNNSYKDQIEWGIQFAEKLKEDYEVYTDVFSGATLERPNLQRLITDIKSGRINKIWVSKLDRLNRDTVGSLIMLDILNAHKIDMYIEGQLKKVESPTEIFAYTVESAVATMEKGIIRERMNKGKKRIRREGYLNTAIPPYGYDAFYNEDGKRKVITVEHEVEIILYIFDQFVNKNCTYDSIYKELNNRIIKPRNGSQWYTQSIINIINQSLYAGYYNYENKEVKSKIYPVIIDRELFDKAKFIAQEKRRNYNTHYNHNKSTTLFRCWYCGRSFTFHNRRRPIHKNGVVVDYKFQPTYKINHKPDCDRIGLRQAFNPKDKLDYIVDKMFFDFITDQDSIEEYFLMQREKNKSYEERQKNDIERLEAEKAKINKQKKKSLKLFLQVDDEDLSGEIEELSNKEKDISAKIEVIKKDLNMSREELDDRLAILADDMEEEYRSLEDEPFLQRQYLLKLREDAYIKNHKLYWKWCTGKEVYYSYDTIDDMYNEYITTTPPEELSTAEINYKPRKRRNWKEIKVS